MTTSGGGNIQCLTAQTTINPTVANTTSTASTSSSSTTPLNVSTTIAQIQLPTTSSTASPSILHPISLATLTATAPKSLILNTNLNSSPSTATVTSTASIPLSTATTTTRLLNHPIPIPSAAIIDTNKLIKSTGTNEANLAIPISSSAPTIASSSPIVPSTTISLTNLSKLTTTTTTGSSNQVPPSKITLQPIPNANNLVKNLLSNSANTSTNSNANGSNQSNLPASLATNAQNLLNTTASSGHNSTAILNAAAAAQAAASYYSLIAPSNNGEINNNSNGSKLNHNIVTTLPSATISNVKTTSGNISSTTATTNTNQINIPQPKIILSNSSSSSSLSTNAIATTTTTPTIARTILSNSNSSPASFATLIGLDSSKINLKTTNISTSSSTSSTNATPSTNGSIGTSINIKSLSPTVSSLSTTNIIDSNSSTTSSTNHSSSKITQLTRNLQTHSGSNVSQQAHSSPSVISKKLNVNTKITQPTYNSISTAPTIAQLYTANSNTNSSVVNPIQFHIKNVTTQATSAVASPQLTPQLIQSLQPIRLIANNNQSVITSNTPQATTVTLANNMFPANNSNFHHLLSNNSLNTISNSNVNTNNGNNNNNNNNNNNSSTNTSHSISNTTVPLTNTTTLLNLNTQQQATTTTTVNISSPTSSPIKPNIIRKPRRDSPSHTSLNSVSQFASSSLIKDIKPPVFKTDNNAGSINSATMSAKVITNQISSSSSIPSSSSASSSSSSSSSSSNTGANGEQTIINLTSASNQAQILALQQKPNAHAAKLILDNEKLLLLNQPSSSTQPTSSTCTSLNVQQQQASEINNSTLMNQSQTTTNRKRRKQEFKLGASDEPLVSYTMPTTNFLDTGRYLNENPNRLNQHSSQTAMKSSQRIPKTLNSKQNKNLTNGIAVIADCEEMQLMVNTNRSSPGSSSLGSCQDTMNNCDDECKSAKQPRLSQNHVGNEHHNHIQAQNYRFNRNNDCGDDDSEQIDYLDEERQCSELMNGNENSNDSLLDDQQVELLSKEFKYTCSSGLKWSAKPRAGSIPIRSITNSYKPNWKPNQHHYEKYSDIKLKDLVNQNTQKANQLNQGQLSPTCTSNQTNLITHKDLVDNLSEWRFHYVISQVNNLIDYENESMQLIEELDELLNNSDELKLKYFQISDTTKNSINTSTNSFTGFNEISFKLKESIKANAQRHKYVNEQLDETHNLIKKLLQHKEKFKNYLLTSSFSPNNQKNSTINIDNGANVNNSTNGVNNVTNAKNNSTKKSSVSCGVERSKKKKPLKRHSSKNSNELK